MHVLLKFTNIDLKQQALLSDPPTKTGNDVISLLWQLLCQHNTAHDKFSSLSDKAGVIVFPHRSLLMATSFVLRLGTYYIGPEKANLAILLSQNKLLVLCTLNYYRMIDSDPLWSILLQTADHHFFESGYIAFMVTSSQRRHMWWARKASARGMHGRYTWQVAEINKKWGLGKEWIERCLMQEA